MQEPLERNNGVSNFDPYTKDPVTGLLGRTVYAGFDGQPRSFRPDVHANFAPRFGLAWDPLGDGKLVVRGGYAIYYPSIFAQFNFGSAAGFSSTNTSYISPGNNANVPAFQFSQGLPFLPIEPQGSKLGSNPFLGQSVSYEENDGTKPMSQQWSFSIQKKLGSNWMIDATYSGNRGQHFAAGGYDANQLDPQYLSLGQGLNSQVANPNAGKVPGSLGGATIARSQALKPYPQYTAINVASPRLGSFSSNLLMLSVEKRMSHGWQANFSYTLSPREIRIAIAAPRAWVWSSPSPFDRASSRRIVASWPFTAAAPAMNSAFAHAGTAPSASVTSRIRASPSANLGRIACSSPASSTGLAIWRRRLFGLLVVVMIGSYRGTSALTP